MIQLFHAQYTNLYVGHLFFSCQFNTSFLQYCEKVGQTKTVAIERALKKYLVEFQKDKEK